MTDIDYLTDIPNGPNNPSVDQPNMKINTNGVADWVVEDHYGFKDINGGRHQFVRWPIANKPASTGAKELLLYNGSPDGTNFYLYYVRNNSPTDIAHFVQMTRNEVPVQATNGYTWMPGNILLQWGQFTSVGTGSPNATVPLLTNFASSAEFYSVTCTVLNNTSASYVKVNSLSNNQFTATVVGSNTGTPQNGITFCWMALGK